MPPHSLGFLLSFAMTRNKLSDYTTSIKIGDDISEALVCHMSILSKRHPKGGTSSSVYTQYNPLILYTECEAEYHQGGIGLSALHPKNGHQDPASLVKGHCLYTVSYIT